MYLTCPLCRRSRIFLIWCFVKKWPAFAWSIVVIAFTILTVWKFLVALLAWRVLRRSRCVYFSRWPHVPKQTGIYGASHHLGSQMHWWNRVALVLEGIIVRADSFGYRCFKIHWRRLKGFAPMDIWSPYRWITAKVFDIPKSRTTPLHKLLLDGHAMFVGRVLLVCAVCFDIAWMPLMEDVRLRVLCSESTQRSPSGAVGSALRENELAPYHDDDADDWIFADVPIDSQVDVSASPRPEFDAINGFSCSASAKVPKDGNEVFSLKVQNLDTVTECVQSCGCSQDCGIRARVCRWGDRSCVIFQRDISEDGFDSRLRWVACRCAAPQQRLGSGPQTNVAQVTLQSELIDGRDSPSWLEDRWRPGRDHARATERHLAEGLTSVLWLKPRWKTRSTISRLLRLHCSTFWEQMWSRVCLPLVRVGFSIFRCRKVSGISSRSFLITTLPKGWTPRHYVWLLGFCHDHGA